jgi:chloramphenicol 3-O-phosphotransferase
MKAFLVFCFSLLVCLTTHADPGKIVLFNGTSSAGKTSLAEAMIQKSKQKYEVVSFDDFHRSYLKEHGLTRMNRVQYDDFLVSLYRHAKAKSEAGRNIIIDTVEFELAYDRYCEILDCPQVVKVIVYCPLDNILQRIEKRNSSDDRSGRRPVLLSFLQFVRMYKPQASLEELVVDKTSTSRLRKALAEAGKKAGNPKEYEALYEEYVKTFGIDKDQALVIVPNRKYDLLINTKTRSKKENVRILENYIRSRN